MLLMFWDTAFLWRADGSSDFQRVERWRGFRHASIMSDVILGVCAVFRSAVWGARTAVGCILSLKAGIQ